MLTNDQLQVIRACSKDDAAFQQVLHIIATLMAPHTRPSHSLPSHSAHDGNAAYYHTLLAALPYSILSLDDQGTILSALGTGDIFGMPVANLVNTLVTDNLPGPCARWILHQLTTSTETTEVSSLMFQWIEHTTGRRMECRMAHGPQGVTLLLLRDMTDLLQSPDMTAALTDEPPAPAESEDSVPPRILVAEDSLVNQRIILRFLEHLGYSADLAANGHDVLRLMHEQPYDIILMDVQMPELDGIETTRRIRAEYPAHQQPRIIALTAYTQQHELEQCIEAGMNGHMSKSLRLNELAAVLAQYRPQAAAPPSDRTPLPAPEEVIDERVLHQLINQLGSNGLARFDELITIFLEHTTGFFSEIERALEENNEQHLRYIAHTLKSSSASLGATRLSARCRDVIDACAANDQARARASARQIITELHAAQAALTQIQADNNVRLNDDASS